MKGWEISGNAVTRQGKVIATLRDKGEFEITEGMDKYRPSLVRFLRGEGYLAPSGKPEVEPKKPPVTVEVTASNIEKQSESPSEGFGEKSDPDTETFSETPPVVTEDSLEDKEPIPSSRPDFPLPKDVRIEQPPKEICFPGHKSTLYFTKNGHSRRLGLDHVPTNEEVLTIIARFKKQ